MFTQEELNQKIQTAIEQMAYPTEAPRLFDPARYALSAGGKRLRPTLALMAANLYTDDVDLALTPAVGIEMYHNFTLLHDDVMDNAPTRRGRPTVHVRWDSNTAILTGDVMQGLAYDMIAAAPAPVLKTVIDLFTRTNIQICEGQQLDMEFENRLDVTTAEYIEMIRLKTAVLLGCALKTGALIGGAPRDEAEKLYHFGENIGLAFQLQDDWLDCWGDPATFGKRIGGDILNGKKTYLLINALAKADGQDRETLLRELSPDTAQLSPSEKIDSFIHIYIRCGAETSCREAIRHYQEQGLTLLQSLNVPAERLGQLTSLIDKLTQRAS